MLAISRFRVVNGLEQKVRQAFQERPHLVEQAPGFRGMNVFTETGDPRTFLLITRWTDLESYRAWHSSEAHDLSHSGIPSGLKLDATQTQLTFWDEIPQSPGESGPAFAPLLEDFLSSSGVVHFLAAGLDGVIQATNAQMTQLLGAAGQELRGRSLWPYLTEPDANSLRRIAGCDRDAKGPNGAVIREFPRGLLLNFVGPGLAPQTLECQVYVQQSGFALMGNIPFQQNLAQEKELREVNNELAVLMREHARQNKELKAAKLELEKTLREINTVYWHLRRIGEVLPICVKCGKVESGKAHWNTLIDFMQEHFPFLSHGYCPECAVEARDAGGNPGPPT
jgi:heme-degrading monooxygenase HmoA